MKKLNDLASGLGAGLIVIPFIISVILAFVAVSLGDPMAVGGIAMYTPEHYADMTPVEREAWLNNNHEGVPVYEWRWEITWSVNLFGQWHYVFPDGFDMTQGQWEKFVYGDAGETDYYQIALAVLSLNPPLLSYIGVAGILIRIILVVCVAVGLVELIWIG